MINISHLDFVTNKSIVEAVQIFIALPKCYQNRCKDNKIFLKLNATSTQPLLSIIRSAIHSLTYE